MEIEDCISREATVERLCKIAEIMNKKRDGLGSPYVMAALLFKAIKMNFHQSRQSKRWGGG